MPFASFVQRASLIAAAVGFTAYGLATTPAAALPLSGLLHPGKPVEFGNKPMPMPNPSKPAPSGPVVNNHPPINICPLYKPECKGPPKANPNPPAGGHGPVVINPPPVIIAPPPVVVAAPPAVIARPMPVYVPRPMPMPAQAPTAAPVAAAPSCNCLTKQYQPDGSVVFRDVCTHEAAMATQADLQAQAQSAPQSPNQNSSQDQAQATPAR